MHIRAGAADDLEAMYELDCVCFQAPFRFSRAAMRRYITAAGAFTLVAEEAGQFAGFVVVQMNQRDGYLVTLDVAPALRRRGLARALLVRAEAEARQLGADSLSLHVWVENAAAMRFYDALGFVPVMLDSGFYGADTDAWGYRKVLG